MKLRQAKGALAVALVVALAGASTAHAASVEVANGKLSYTAGAGESNALSITFADGAYEVQDTGTSGNSRVFLQPGPGCLPASSPGVLRCNAAGVSAISAEMADANDTASLNVAIPATLHGSDGADNLTAGAGNDRLDGGAGDDTLNGAQGADVVTGGDGVDATEGGAGNDVLEGGAGNDTLGGGDDNDTLDGGSGADSIQGGEERDSADYSSRREPLTLTLDGDANDGASGESDRIASDVEDLAGGAGSDTLTGNDQPNSLAGGAGHDVIDGALGPDVLTGGSGADQLTGGSDDDVLSGGDGDDGLAGGLGADLQSGGPGSDFAGYIGRTEGVSVVIDDVANDGRAGEGDNVQSDIEGLYGSEGADVLTGDGDDNIVVGAGGNDVVDGAGGNDLMTGNAGADTIRGGDGNDFVSFDEPGPLSLTLDGAANDGLPGEADNVLSDVENLIGTSGTDQLTGDEKANTLVGEGGDDSITGGAGFDVFDGGAGNDTIEARDGGPDALQCGPGDDVAQIDSLDAVDSSCEHVLAEASFELAERGLVATRKGVIRVRIACPAQAIGGCNGRLALSLSDRRLARKRAIEVASTAVRLAKSEARVVNIRLSRNDLRVLMGLRKTSALLALTLDDGAGHTTTVTKKSRLAMAPKPKKKRPKR